MSKGKLKKSSSKVKKRNIRFEVLRTGAPYPDDSWWRIVGSNGRKFTHSENMGKKNAIKSIMQIVKAIKENRFTIVERAAGTY